MRRREVRLAGFGGQGVILAGHILGRAAALYDGKHAVVAQSFGPEARGGACAAEVVIAEEPVDYPKVLDPSTLVVMSQEAFELYGRNGSNLLEMLVDADLVKAPPGTKPAPRAIPFTATAEALGKKLVTNVVMLGALTGYSKLVSPEAVGRALADVIPAKAMEVNRKAFAKGLELGLAARGAPP